jgi:hypothetical protein
MAAAGDFSEFGDPEDAAGELADRAYLKVVLARFLRMAAVLLAGLAVSAGDYAFGVLALPLLPRVLSWLLAGFIAGELCLGLSGLRRDRALRRLQEAGLSSQERSAASLERMRERPEPWWRHGARTRAFWAGAGFRAVYSACFGLVLASWTSVPAGIGTAAGYTVLILALGSQFGPSVSGWASAAAFAVDHGPRDTPEA